MDKCNAKKLLQDNQLKTTKQRLLVLEEIILIKKIFTANVLFNKFQKDMDLVTIYRVLSIFQKKGIIREILNNQDVKKYELSCIHNPIHPHFSCNICGNLICLKALDKKLILQLQENCSNYQVDNIVLQYNGICNNCT